MAANPSNKMECFVSCMDGDIVSVQLKGYVPDHKYMNEPPMHVCIYVICCKDVSILDTYIGQTRDFEVRKSYHYEDSKVGKQKVHRFVNSHGGWDNWDIRVLHEYMCDFVESHVIEWYWWCMYSSTLNKVKPGYKYTATMTLDEARAIEVKCRL